MFSGSFEEERRTTTSPATPNNTCGKYTLSEK
jgi:hypothetical protein